MRIEDGKGNHGDASVSVDQRLDVNSKVGDRIYYVSRDKGSSFMAYGQRTFAAANTNENVFYLKYIGNNLLFVESITFTTNSTLAKCEVYVDPTSVSGGGSRVALNLNRTKNISSETTLLDGSSTLTATVVSADEILDVRLNQSSFTFKFNNAFILGKNDSFLILGSVGTIGNVIKTSVFFYEETIQ